MREMHKWRDKVELSLDNRQVFFLFFGLSVVGCFVFALGVMVGRRVDFESGTTAIASRAESEASIDDVEALIEPMLSFKEGLAEPSTLGLPATRGLDAEVEPAQEPEPSQPASELKEETLAGTSARAVEPQLDGKKFTLQMKAFSRKEDADAFTSRLRERGHAARVESHEVNGRLWYRVRVGAFENWNDGIAAKEAFEKNEAVIAYVVRL